MPKNYSLGRLVVGKRFSDISYVTSDNTKDIVDDFTRFILSSGVSTSDIPIFDTDTIQALGSTRAMLIGLSNAKDESSDIDLIATAITDNRDATTKLVERMTGHGIDSFISFGSIVSIKYPFNEKFYQIDLMIANPSYGGDIHSYMYEFKYWSDEAPTHESGLPIKGAHRSELIKSLVKANGLSAAENGFKQFLWNDDMLDTEALIEILRKKTRRFRLVEKKRQTAELIDILETTFTTGIDYLRSYLSIDGVLNTRFAFGHFSKVPFGYEVLIDLLFNRVYIETPWRDELDRRFSTNNCISSLGTFTSAMQFIRQQLDENKIQQTDVIGVFHDMRKSFTTNKANVMWGDGFVAYIESIFPFMQENW